MINKSAQLRYVMDKYFSCMGFRVSRIACGALEEQ